MRRRKPTPRTVSIQPASPSLRRSAATCTSIVFVEPYQLVSQTSSSRLRRDYRRAGIASEHGEQVELLRRQVELAAAEPHAPRARIDLELTDLHRSVRGRPSGRAA